MKQVHLDARLTVLFSNQNKLFFALAIYNHYIPRNSNGTRLTLKTALHIQKDFFVFIIFTYMKNFLLR